MLDFIQDAFSRAWTDLLARPGGPMSFRFLLQPAMAAIVAIRDGRRDARAGRPPYFWRVLTHPEQRARLLREDLRATTRILFLGLAMDAIYQFVTLRTFYPFEALIVVFALAFVPYLLIRGPVERIARWWRQRRVSHAPGTPEQGKWKR